MCAFLLQIKMDHTQYIKHANMMKLHITNQENNLFQRTISRNFCPGYQTKMSCWYFQKRLLNLNSSQFFLSTCINNYRHTYMHGREVKCTPKHSLNAYTWITGLEHQQPEPVDTVTRRWSPEHLLGCCFFLSNPLWLPVQLCLRIQPSMPSHCLFTVTSAKRGAPVWCIHIIVNPQNIRCCHILSTPPQLKLHHVQHVLLAGVSRVAGLSVSTIPAGCAGCALGSFLAAATKK